MERVIQLTADGSHTIAIPAMEVTFHSVHGAIQESLHVFIEAALHYVLGRPEQAGIHAPLAILEMGFGTGLNALLTLREAIRLQRRIYYQTVERYPLTAAEAAGLNYAARLAEPALAPLLEQMHSCPWEQDVPIHPCFVLRKSHTALQELQLSRHFDIVYYDAFAPKAQPELWTEAIFTQLLHSLAPGGILTTYCSKSIVRKAMLAAGFQVEKIPGPPHKREMLRAIKPI